MTVVNVKCGSYFKCWGQMDSYLQIRLKLQQNLTQQKQADNNCTQRPTQMLPLSLQVNVRLNEGKYSLKANRERFKRKTVEIRK